MIKYNLFILPHFRMLTAITTFLAFSTVVSAVEIGDTTRLTISGTIVAAPECTVNGNNIVDVAFPDMLITRVGSEDSKKQIIYQLSCPGLIDDRLRIAIYDKNNLFADTISTNRPGLAIQLFSGSTKLSTGEFISFSYKEGPPSLFALPVAVDQELLESGAFEGTGIMVIEYN